MCDLKANNFFNFNIPINLHFHFCLSLSRYHPQHMNAIVEGALRNVNLIIEPPAVRRGQHAIVRCLYDLEGTPLYSAKFIAVNWSSIAIHLVNFRIRKFFHFPAYMWISSFALRKPSECHQYHSGSGKRRNSRATTQRGVTVSMWGCRVTNSNATQVLIRNVGFGLSGNFSCEVTADAPLFSTATATELCKLSHWKSFEK
ncbi:unnamed protein product [Ceratitis capitata]|uniref:(Mediterranean fruit fly) hypothetical protein n=1 Tax=Ceratitis capitata TaxID=7213 RepID=A0A811U8S6_CERCA|nr:unnamed protein product [Ceratitis capitata]